MIILRKKKKCCFKIQNILFHIKKIYFSRSSVLFVWITFLFKILAWKSFFFFSYPSCVHRSLLLDIAFAFTCVVALLDVTRRELNANKLKHPETVARQIRPRCVEHSLETATFVHDFAAICDDTMHLLSVLIVVSSVLLSERKESRGGERGDIWAMVPPASIWRSREALGALILIRKL